jgi:hypothetical protein
LRVGHPLANKISQMSFVFPVNFSAKFFLIHQGQIIAQVKKRSLNI